MNREQNNSNTNNFNTQVNNGMPNNQPFNSQQIHQLPTNQMNMQETIPQPTINQMNMQETIPQPTTNQMNMQETIPQPTINQMNMQETIPQPINKFESSNASKQSFNSKPPKKINLGLIIGGIAAVAVIVTGIIIVPKIFNNNSSSTNGENNFTSNIKKGNAELTMISKNAIRNYKEDMIYYKNYEYFETKNSENQFIVVDSKGKQVLPIDNKKLSGETPKYLGDGYFIYNTYTNDNKKTAIVVKDGKLIVSLDSYSDELHYVLAKKCAYKNGILYAGIPTNDKIVAYDIKNKKELWQIDGTFVDGYVLDDDFIRVQTSINPSGGNSSFLSYSVPNTIVDYNGKKIISGADIEPIESFGRKKYDTQIYTSKSNSYLEIKNNDYVKVYDLHKNLKTTISMKETDENVYYFSFLLYSGVFIIQECQKQPYSCKDILYNESGKELIRVDSISVESNHSVIGDEYIFSKNLDLISTRNSENEERTSSCVLIKNGEIAATYKNCKDAKHNYGLNHNYLFYYEPDAENPLTYGGYTYKIVNLNNMKVVKAPIEYTTNTDISNQSPYGSYVVLTTGNKSYVYDSDFNLKYESEYGIRPVNEEYVISSNKVERDGKEVIEINLINIETGKVNKLDVKGKYYDNNAKGLVTYDGVNYYLYALK